jgi:hypothetical protein
LSSPTSRHKKHWERERERVAMGGRGMDRCGREERLEKKRRI